MKEPEYNDIRVEVLGTKRRCERRVDRYPYTQGCAGPCMRSAFFGISWTDEHGTRHTDHFCRQHARKVWRRTMRRYEKGAG